MYAAIDSLVDKLDRTIIKHKEKNLGHRYSNAPLKQQALQEVQEDLPE